MIKQIVVKTFNDTISLILIHMVIILIKTKPCARYCEKLEVVGKK